VVLAHTEICESSEKPTSKAPSFFLIVIVWLNPRTVVVPAARYNPALKGEGSLDKSRGCCIASRGNASPPEGSQASLWPLRPDLPNPGKKHLSRPGRSKKRLLGRKGARVEFLRVGGIPQTLEASTCLSRIMQAPIECTKSPSARVARSNDHVSSHHGSELLGAIGSLLLNPRCSSTFLTEDSIQRIMFGKRHRRQNSMLSTKGNISRKNICLHKG
jgi:hypothetical protein